MTGVSDPGNPLKVEELVIAIMALSETLCPVSVITLTFRMLAMNIIAHDRNVIILHAVSVRGFVMTS